MFKNLQLAVQRIQDEMVLKDNYDKELEELQQIESDMSVFRSMGVPVWKCVNLREEINQIRNWIKEELASK